MSTKDPYSSRVILFASWSFSETMEGLALIEKLWILMESNFSLTCLLTLRKGHIANSSECLVYNVSSLPLSFLSLYRTTRLLQHSTKKKKAICTKQVVLALGQIAYPFKNFLIYSDEMVMKGTDLRLSHKKPSRTQIVISCFIFSSSSKYVYPSCLL